MPRVVLVILCLSVALQNLLAGLSEPDAHCLWYRQPAAERSQALPVGNGSLGALVFSHPDAEHLLLGLDRLWIAPENPPGNRSPGGNRLEELRAELFAEGSSAEFDERFQAEFGSEGGLGRPAALGALYLRFPGELPAVSAYRRQLCLDQGRLLAEWERGEDRISQEVFASHPDQVLVVHYRIEPIGPIEAVAPDEADAIVPSGPTLSLEVGLVDGSGGERRSQIETVGSDVLRLAGLIGPGARDEGAGLELPANQRILRYEARLQVVAPDAEIRLLDDGRLAISNAREITLLLAADCSFESVEPTAIVTESLGRAAGHHLEVLRERHLEDFGRMMERVSLEIHASGEETSLSTAERLERLREGAEDPGLLAQLFDYGRYLLVSSSRPGSVPVTRRGLWPTLADPDENAAHYDLAGRLPLSYAMTGPCNLDECQQPMLELTERLAAKGRRLAQAFNSHGWCASAHTDAWGHVGLFAIDGGWIHGGTTLLSNLWETWVFAGDQKLLRSRLYPLLASLSRFYLDWLVEQPGTALLSAAPDRSPATAGLIPLGIGTAATQQLVTDLFDHTLEAAHLLDERDHDFLHRLHDTRSHLRSGLLQDAQGRLRQREKSLAAAELATPHLGALHAVYPSDLLARSHQEGLESAAIDSLDLRLQRSEVAGQSWLRAWAAAQYTRLDRPEAAAGLLDAIAREDLQPNLVVGRDQRADLSANFLITAALAEALLQSHDAGVGIELLPALPPAWASWGRVRGLRARGGFVVDFAWQQGQVVEYEIWYDGDRRAESIPALVNGQRVELQPRPLRQRGN